MEGATRSQAFWPFRRTLDLGVAAPHPYAACLASSL